MKPLPLNSEECGQTMTRHQRSALYGAGTMGDYFLLIFPHFFSVVQSPFDNWHSSFSPTTFFEIGVCEITWRVVCNATYISYTHTKHSWMKCFWKSGLENLTVQKNILFFWDVIDVLTTSHFLSLNLGRTYVIESTLFSFYNVIMLTGSKAPNCRPFTISRTNSFMSFAFSLKIVFTHSHSSGG